MIKQEVEDLKNSLQELNTNDLMLEKLERNGQNLCNTWLCGTCGGMYHRIIRHMDLKTSSKISKVLKSADLKDLERLGDFESILINVDRKGYISMLIREAKTLDLFDLWQRHKFISRVENLSHYENDELDLLYSKIKKQHDLGNERERLEVKAALIYESEHLDWSNLDDIDKFIFHNRGYRLNDEFSSLYRKIVERATKESVKNSHESLTETLILTLNKKAMDYPELVGHALQIAIHNKQMKKVLYNTLREVIDDVNDYRGDGGGYEAYLCRIGAYDY